MRAHGALREPSASAINWPLRTCSPMLTTGWAGSPTCCVMGNCQQFRQRCNDDIARSRDFFVAGKPEAAVKLAQVKSRRSLCHVAGTMRIQFTGARWNAQLAAGALTDDDRVHQLMCADDGVNRAGHPCSVCIRYRSFRQSLPWAPAAGTAASGGYAVVSEQLRQALHCLLTALGGQRLMATAFSAIAAA